jgi:hypothetical protein
VLAKPSLERLAIQIGRVGGSPRCLHGNALRHRVQQLHRRGDLARDQRIRRSCPGRTVFGVGEVRALPLVDVVAEDVCRIGGEPKLGHQCVHPILRWPHPLAAGFDHLAAADRVVEGAPADTMSCFENQHRAAVSPQFSRCRKPGEPSSDDHNVGSLARCGRAVRAPTGGIRGFAGEGRSGGRGSCDTEQAPTRDARPGMLVAHRRLHRGVGRILKSGPFCNLPASIGFVSAKGIDEADMSDRAQASPPGHDTEAGLARECHTALAHLRELGADRRAGHRQSSTQRWVLARDGSPVFGSQRNARERYSCLTSHPRFIREARPRAKNLQTNRTSCPRSHRASTLGNVQAP